MLTATYDVTVFDVTTRSTQTDRRHDRSLDDAIVVNTLAASLAYTLAIDDGQVVAFGGLITDAGDLGNMLSVTELNGRPVAGFLEIRRPPYADGFRRGSFFVAGDLDARSGSFTVLWDGMPVRALTNFTGGAGRA